MSASSTEVKKGATSCVAQYNNFLPLSLQVTGYTFFALSWALAFGFGCWLVRHRQDPVLLIGQFEFLMLIFIGATISTTTIFTKIWYVSHWAEDGSLPMSEGIAIVDYSKIAIRL